MFVTVILFQIKITTPPLLPRESHLVIPSEFRGGFVWRYKNKPIELWSNNVIDEKIDYIHKNPVEEGNVFRPEDYLDSSAANYTWKDKLLENVIVVK